MRHQDEIWSSYCYYYHVVVEVLGFGAMCICRSIPTFRTFSHSTPSPPPHLPEGSLLVHIQFPYFLPLIGYLPAVLALQVLYKPFTSLPCHFSPWRWRQKVSSKRQHRSANTHGAKDFYNNMIRYQVYSGYMERMKEISCVEWSLLIPDAVCLLLTFLCYSWK
jgi:hypothetical protein